MTKTTWVDIALCMLLAGLLIFGGVMMGMKWDFFRFSLSKYETNEHTVNGPCSDITVISDTANIILVASEGEGVRVVCHEKVNAKHTVSFEDGRLLIEVNDQRKWYEHINMFGAPKITVYLPGGEYGALAISRSTGRVEIPADFSFTSLDVVGSTGDTVCRASVAGSLKIEASTGKIELGDLSAGKIELKTTTGDMELESVACAGDASLCVKTGDIEVDSLAAGGTVTVSVSTGKAELRVLSCKRLVSSGSTGSLYLEDVTAEEDFELTRTTGDIHLSDCDAARLEMKAGTGNIEGSLRSPKIFYAETRTGKIRVPMSEVGGICRAKTSTGDIILSIE